MSLISVMSILVLIFVLFFFFNDTATTEIYTLSLHDALPIWSRAPLVVMLRDESGYAQASWFHGAYLARVFERGQRLVRSEEHTSELQSQSNLVCRLLLEKKKQILPYALTDHACMRWRIHATA